jgi:hypothetical protein
MAEIDVLTATIGAAQTTSGEVDIGTKSLVGLQLPAAWVTAAITFQVSIDGGATFGTLIDGSTGTAYTIPSVSGGAQAYVAIDPAKLRGVTSLKIVSGASQTNGVTISLITRLAL